MEFNSAIQDVKQGLRNYEFWITFGLNDIKSQYRRSRLGQLWFTLSVAIFILVIGGLYQSVFGNNYENYFIYMATGYVTWILLQGIVTGGTRALTESVAFLNQKNWPKSVFSARVIYRELIVFLHNATLLFFIFLWKLHWPGLVNFFWAIIGIGMIVYTGFWVALFLSIINLRFRDVQPIVQSLMRMIFFATPIIWVSRSLGEIGEIIYLINPFRYFLDIVREPLLGNGMPMQEFCVVLALGMIATGVCLFLLSVTKNKITFWL